MKFYQIYLLFLRYPLINTVKVILRNSKVMNISVFKPQANILMQIILYLVRINVSSTKLILCMHLYINGRHDVHNDPFGVTL